MAPQVGQSVNTLKPRTVSTARSVGLPGDVVRTKSADSSTDPRQPPHIATSPYCQLTWLMVSEPPAESLSLFCSVSPITGLQSPTAGHRLGHACAWRARSHAGLPIAEEMFSNLFLSRSLYFRIASFAEETFSNVAEPTFHRPFPPDVFSHEPLERIPLSWIVGESDRLAAPI